MKPVALIARKIRSALSRITTWCRTCFAALVTLLVPTKTGLWRKIAFAGRPPWDERNKIIAGFIPAGSSVLDIGCGAQTLKQHLPPGCKYQPADLVKSSPHVILCDLNQGLYPDIREKFDYVVCSGVFEYVRRPEEFLRKIPVFGRSVLMSYCPLYPGDSKLQRLGNGYGWINHFKKEELEALYDQMGLNWRVLHSDKQKYLIYLVTYGNKSGQA